MPVSLVCESDVSSALHNSLSSSISHSSITSSSQSEQSLQNQLAASSKRVLLTKIDYEEVPNFTNSVHDTLKSKYIILNSSAATTTNINGKVTCNGAVAGPADKSHNNNSLGECAVNLFRLSLRFQRIMTTFSGFVWGLRKQRAFFSSLFSSSSSFFSFFFLCLRRFRRRLVLSFD